MEKRTHQRRVKVRSEAYRKTRAHKQAAKHRTADDSGASMPNKSEEARSPLQRMAAEAARNVKLKSRQADVADKKESARPRG